MARIAAASSRRVSALWKVASQLTEPVEVSVHNKVTAYPHLGVTLVFDQSGRLTGWEQELEVQDGTHLQAVVASSESAMRPVVDALSMSRGERVAVRTVDAKQINPPPGYVLHAETGHFTVRGFDARLIASLRIPDPAKLAGADPRLRSWLDLVNEARDATRDEDAMRMYAVIWEDVYGRRPRGPATTPAHELFYTRDFVSHAKLTHKYPLAFIRDRLGPSVDRFNRHDAAHRAFVQQQRWAAHGLVLADLHSRVF